MGSIRSGAQDGTLLMGGMAFCGLIVNTSLHVLKLVFSGEKEPYRS